MSRVSGLAELVRLMVLRGELPAGGRVLELHLAERLHASRSTVREVLRQLEGRGLLVANESGGMRVAILDAEDVAATVLVRAELEALSAHLASGRVEDGTLPAADVRALADLADAAEAATRIHGAEAAVLADRTFHRALGGLAGNRPCHDALDRLWDRIVVAAWQSPPPRAGNADAEHRDLLDAIAAGDAPRAAGAARRHVLGAVA
jgi:DNA-binding GntR family transcriptional regulator